MAGRTTVSIRGDEFLVNGRPTYEGREYQGRRVQGLLMNSRMVQATFDDLNPETVGRWAYPDTGRWDPERNLREFLAAMPEWRAHGLLAVTVNLQGGCPIPYTEHQPWHNSAFQADGSLREDYLDRMARVLDRADELGMAVILGVFYFGQDERLADEAAVIRGLDNALEWLLARGDRNVLVEVNNECDLPQYEHEVLRPSRIHELIARVRESSQAAGHRLLVGTSFRGGAVPVDCVAAESDFLLMHGNGVGDPNRIRAMVDEARALPSYRPMPILFNEDDHFGFDQPDNNLLGALSRYASWGYFDPGSGNYRDGYQAPPVNWSLSTERKRAFFQTVARITGATP